MSDRILVGRWFETKWQDNRSTRETAMKIRVLWIALVALLAVSFGFGCGGDSGGTAGTGDTGGKGGSIAAAGSGAVVCAKETCKLPDGVTGELCCMDPFAGGCGIKSGQSCRAFPSAADARCPAISLGGFMMPGSGGSGGAGGAGAGVTACCASNGECGFSIGIGTGCMAISATCSFIPRQLITMLTAQKCDGTPVTLPADCGSTTGFGGRGGGAGTGAAGTGTAGAAGTGTAGAAGTGTAGAAGTGTAGAAGTATAGAAGH
jgi:hypothetical protein